MQVPPAELEFVLLSHPAVADAAVVPLQDEDAGEIPRAFVVLKAPAGADELIEYVAQRVAFKKIRRLDFIDAIPKSPSGKILRRLFRDIASHDRFPLPASSFQLSAAACPARSISSYMLPEPRASDDTAPCYARMMTTLLLAMTTTLALAAAPAEKPAIIVEGPEPPVRISRAAVLVPAEGPTVVLYAAVNQTDQEMEQFTVMAFVFKADGTPKARQVAPGRRTLEPKETKYSTIVLDAGPVDPSDIIVIGVDQAQRAGSETWWHTDLRPLAEKAVPILEK